MWVYIKCILVSILWGIFQTLFYLYSNEQIFFSDIIFSFCFAKSMIAGPSIINMTLLFLPYFMFQILFGTSIYRHFCSASIYYFSRCGNRVRWMRKEAVSLYCKAFVYLFCMVAGGIITARITHVVIFDTKSLLLFFYYLVIYSLWLYITTILVNAFAVQYNSSTAFLLIAGVETACIFLLLLWEKILPLSDSVYSERNWMLLKLNPISHLVLAWHSSFYEDLNVEINLYSMPFDLNFTVMIFFVISIIATECGCMIVKKKDFINSNNETGGV